MPDHINPDGIPLDLLKPEEVIAAAAALRRWAVRRRPRGLCCSGPGTAWLHHYQAPESHGLLTIMDPVKANAHTFGENTSTVARALKAYAVEQERVKTELTRIKRAAQTFVTAIDGGVTQHHAVPKGGVMSTKVPWHEDQPSIDTNNALLAQVDAQLTALEDAQRRCANSIYDIIGFPHGPVQRLLAARVSCRPGRARSRCPGVLRCSGPSTARSEPFGPTSTMPGTGSPCSGSVGRRKG